MRSYPQNSPCAAARIVALAMLADGNMCTSELDTFNRLNAHDQLGLDKSEFHAVIHAFCEDLLAVAHASWGDPCGMGTGTLAGLMAEVDIPELQRKVVDICVAVARADGHLAGSESVVVVAAAEHWGLRQVDLASGGKQG
jgi:uncharacterized tellurite resistance protein B-like protein